MISGVTVKSGESFRTDKIGLVAFLQLQGHTSQNVKWEGGTCYWYFLATELLLEQVDKFMRREALVEPNSFDQEFFKVKKVFWDTDPRGLRPNRH